MIVMKTSEWMLNEKRWRLWIVWMTTTPTTESMSFLSVMAGF